MSGLYCLGLGVTTTSIYVNKDLCLTLKITLAIRNISLMFVKDIYFNVKLLIELKFMLFLCFVFNVS